MEMTELKDLLKIIIERKNEHFVKLQTWDVPQIELELERIDGQRTAYQIVLDAITGLPGLLRYIPTGDPDKSNDSHRAIPITEQSRYCGAPSDTPTPVEQRPPQANEKFPLLKYVYKFCKSLHITWNYDEQQAESIEGYCTIKGIKEELDRLFAAVQLICWKRGDGLEAAYDDLLNNNHQLEVDKIALHKRIEGLERDSADDIPEN